MNMAEPTSGGDYDGPCNTQAPVDEPVQAVFSTPQRGDLVVTKPMIPGGITLKIESGNLKKLVSLSSLSYIIQLVFSRVFAAEMWVIRVVSFEATSVRSLLRRQYSIQVESPFHPARSRVVDIWWWRL